MSGLPDLFLFYLKYPAASCRQLSSKDYENNKALIFRLLGTRDEGLIAVTVTVP